MGKEGVHNSWVVLDTFMLLLALAPINSSLSLSNINMIKSMENNDPLKKAEPSDQISSRTPKKLPRPPQRIKYHHQRSTPLPEKYEVLLKFFDAMDASLKLLRLRKSIPVFSKIRVMIENISERRFTHQHLAQLKFLLPEEVELRKVLVADEKTRCMKPDLHLSLNEIRIARADRQKQRSKHTCIRDRLLTQLLKYRKDHPEEMEIPGGELPEPFNQRKHDLLFNSKESSLCLHMEKNSSASVELGTAQASHFPPSFRKHFSKRGLDNESEKSLHSPPQSSGQSTLMPIVNSSVERDLSETVHIAEKKLETPIKSSITPIKPTTPNLHTPKRCKFNIVDEYPSSACKVNVRSSCARSLQFQDPPRYEHVELQDDEEGPDILDLLPENLIQELKGKEERALEVAKRKQMIKNLPKLFDRICIIFQNPKSSAIRKEALIHHLTERHFDITDESEVEEQVNLMQEIIPEWIISKLSPSGNTLYSINKALDPNTLRLTLNKAM